MMYVLN